MFNTSSSYLVLRVFSAFITSEQSFPHTFTYVSLQTPQYTSKACYVCVLITAFKQKDSVKAWQDESFTSARVRVQYYSSGNSGTSTVTATGDSGGVLVSILYVNCACYDAG